MSERRGEEASCSSGVSTPVYTDDESCLNSLPPPRPPSSRENPPTREERRRPPPPEEEKKEAEKKKKKEETFPYPYHAPVTRSTSATTIPGVWKTLPSITYGGTPHLRATFGPIAVGIGPYHHRYSLLEMKDAKCTAQDEYFRVASQRQPREAVREKMLQLVGSARSCYDRTVQHVDDGEFADMMLLDGCFLLQFMVSMCPDDPNAPPDPLMSRPEVHTCMNAIARDVMLLENQIPWLVLEALMELRPGPPVVPVGNFLALMAAAFDIGNDVDHETDLAHLLSCPPPHLLGLFHRRQVGAARAQSHRVPRLSALSTTAVELAEMGVKLASSKTKEFGETNMSKRRRRGLYGELSLAPVVLNDLTSCWLLNMAAYEACLGATEADNFAVGSYVSVVAQLMNREEDVQELRGKGIINSDMSDMTTMEFFKSTARHLRVGHRYYEVFQGLQEYRQERWAWIAIHRFVYKNYKTMAAVLSIIGVLAGLFKTILSLKQPQR